MTPRKLTPAEALECLRDYHDNDVSASDWKRKWAPDSPSIASPVWSDVLMGAIAALGEALSQQQKPAAPHAMEPSCAKCGHPQSNHPFRHPFQPVMLSLGASPPAAPVPSDEEIVAQLGYVMASQGELVEVYGALRLLARRIGVQGVPQ